MSVEIQTNLESVGELIGRLSGIGKGIEEDSYMEELIRDAHGIASNAFDVAAAGAGAAGHIAHMYEFGTSGITPGPIKFADPTSQAARLWIHDIQGKGGDQEIGYIPRVAFNRNPQPTTARTGVPSKYLRKLSKRKYVFRNKAIIMESGAEVKIRSDRGKSGFLFIPTPGANEPRNFVMYPSKLKGAVTVVPGRKTKGQFTSFFFGWWGSQGEAVLSEHMSLQVTKDIEAAEKEMEKRANAYRTKPVQASNPLSVAKRAKFTAEKEFGRNGR